MQNPLLDFTALPRYAAIRAEHVARDRGTHRRRQRDHRTPRHGRSRAHVGSVRRAARRRQREALARLVAGEPPECRGEFAADPRCIQRGAPEGHAVLHGAGPGPAPARGLQGVARRERVRQLPALPAAPCGERAARLPPRRRRAPAAAEGAFPAGAGRAGKLSSRFRTTCSTRPTLSASTSRTCTSFRDSAGRGGRCARLAAKDGARAGS